MAAWVKGDAAETEAAVDAAAALLAAARMPVFAGLSADVAALRAAYRLADRIGASLDPAAGPGLYAELGALASAGALTTTAPETLGRADTVLVIGHRPWDGDLAAELAGEQAYADLAKRLAAAKFGVVVYDAGEIGEAGVEMLQGLLKDLAETTRFFALPMADAFQGRTVLQLSAWTTGQAPRVGFGRHQPEHDPWRFDSDRQVAEGEADVALWLAPLAAPRPGWLGNLPSIAIVGEDSPEARPDTAEIVIAVGVPGTSAGGAVWNERRGVIGYVEATGAPAAVTAAGVLARISDKIAQEGASC